MNIIGLPNSGAQEALLAVTRNTAEAFMRDSATFTSRQTAVPCLRKAETICMTIVAELLSRGGIGSTSCAVVLLIYLRVYQPWEKRKYRSLKTAP